MLTTGFFEDEWFEITDDVIQWGTVRQSLDSERLNKVVFSTLSMQFNNELGSFNDETNPNSYWYGYANIQRTLVKIEAGLVDVTLGDNGIYVLDETQHTTWDADVWDGEGQWDNRPTIYSGVISGDITYSDKMEVTISIMPLTEVFRYFPASALTGFTSTGITASRFFEIVRDQVDINGNYLFRPFFNDTTGSWNILTTTVTYPNLNTSTAQDIFDKNIWQVMEKLAEAENAVVYIDGDGVVNFSSRESNTTTAQYEFHGIGSYDNTYGISIKQIDNFGKKYSKYYSRVSLKYREEDTSTSYEVVESDLEITGTNIPWTLGYKTLEFENLWIQSATAAQTIALQTFNYVSALKKEIAFTTSFVVGLNILDRVSLNYDASVYSSDSFWDVQNWGDTTAATLAQDLVWDVGVGNAIVLQNEEMNLLSIDTNLDRLETKFIARET